MFGSRRLVGALFGLLIFAAGTAVFGQATGTGAYPGGAVGNNAYPGGAVGNGAYTTATSAPTAVPSGYVQPNQADSLIAGFGINTHLSTTGTGYTNCFSQAPGYQCGTSGNSIITALRDLGVRTIRDSSPPGDAYAYEFAGLFSTYGICLNAATQDPNFSNGGGLGYSAANLGTIYTQLGGALCRFEGANEQDINGDPNWYSNLLIEQKVIAGARGTNFPSSIQLIGPPMGGSITSYTTIAAQSPTMLNYMDRSAMHIYWSGRNPETLGYGGTITGCTAQPSSVCGVYGQFSPNAVNQNLEAWPYLPIAVSESGYGDNSADTGYVDATTKAKYMPRLLLQSYWLGNRITEFYEFADEGGPPFSTYGLIDYSLWKKPAYISMQNLFAITKDPGSQFIPTPFQVSISAPADVQYLFFQKRDGTNYIVLWQNDQSWDPNGHTETTPATATANITLGKLPASFTTYTLVPATGAVTVATPAPSLTPAVTVNDGYVIAQVGTPAVAVATASPQPTASPLVSINTLGDRSGNHNNVTQATGANQPGLGTINALGALYYNGTSDSLADTSATGFPTGSAAVSVFSVFTTLSQTNFPFLLVYGNSTNGNSVDLGFHDAAAGGIGFGSQTTSNSYGSASINRAVHSVSGIYSGSAIPTNVTEWLDGNAVTINSGLTGTPNVTGTNFYLGSFFGSSLYWSGLIGETLVYNSALNTTNRQLLEGYLAWKWGTVNALPSNHPYKSAAPVGFTPSSISGLIIWLDPSYAPSINTAL